MGFLTSVGRNEGDSLINETAAEQFSRSLPLDDPLKTLKALCEGLSTITNKRDPDIDQLGVLLTLDHRTERLCEALLTNSVERGARSRSLEATIWQSVLELSSAFGKAYEHFLRQIRGKTSNKGWLERAPCVLVQLFRHREIEALVALFRYELPDGGRWRKLHEAYQFAHALNISGQPVQTSHREGTPRVGTTLEQQYLHILLLQVMNNGRFAPREAYCARQWITGWCATLTLESTAASRQACARDEGFVVDPDGADGLTRPPTELSQTHLYLDPTPMLVLIDDQIKLRRDSVSRASGSASVVLAWQLALLAKLKTVFSVKHARIKRRDERKVVALKTAQVVGGLSSIIRTLHGEWQKTAVVPSSSVPDVEEITFTDLGGYTRAATVAARDGNPLATFPTTGTCDLPQPMWRVRDQSKSGSLLRGRVDDPNCVIPGSLIAFRACDDAQWTMAVVRRLKKLVRSNVEIGVEHIGRNPQGVTMVAASNGESRANGLTGEARERFAALYLRENGEYPKIPIKTLLLPAREFAFGRDVILLSSTTNYTLRLKQPLEPQAEFVWTAFELVKKEIVDPAAAVPR